MNQNNDTELLERIADLRAFVKKTNRETNFLTVIVVLMYFSSAFFGMTSLGWAVLVMAIAVSFYILIAQVTLLQQNTLAEIFERGVHLSAAELRK